MKRKLLSVLLTLCLAFSLLPTAALAEEGEAARTGDLTYTTADETISGFTYTSGTITINAENVTVENVTFGDGARLEVNTPGRFTLKNCTFNGKTEVRTPVTLNVGSATVTGITFNGTKEDGTPSYYNAIEFAVSSGNKLSSATLSNNIFEAAIKNNYFSTYYYADNAVITAENNVIKLANRGSNAIRISNVTNSNVTFNLNNNSYEFSDASGSSEYEGFIILQDFTKKSGNTEDFSKVTINISNLTSPSDASRLFYVWEDSVGLVSDNNPVIKGDSSIEKFFAAKVGDTSYYKTLPEAIAAAQDGDTITLLKDCSSERVNLESKCITIDLNGNTLTSTSAYGVMFCAKNGHKITVNGTKEGSKLVGTLMVTAETDGHIEINGGTYESSQYCPIYINGSVSTDNSTLTVKNATITASNSGSNQDTGCGVYLAGYSTSAFENTTVTAPSTGIEIRAGRLTLTNCNVTGGSGKVTADANGNGTTVKNAALAISQHTTKKPIDVTINGGTFTGTAPIYQTDVQGTGSSNVKAEVKNGQFNGAVSAATDGTIAVSGGTFSSEVPGNCCAPGFVPTQNGNTYGVKINENMAAEVLDAQGKTVGAYDTLAAAITAAKNGETVKLLKDVTENVTIPADKTITLDLNGKKLVNSENAQDDKVADADRKHTITNNGTLTIKDSVGGGIVDNVSHGRAAIYNAGTITEIKGGKFTRSVDNSTDAASAKGNSWYVIYNSENATINKISGGEFLAIGKFSSLFRSDGTIDEISGGTFTQDGFIAFKNQGTVKKISGGTFSSKEQSCIQNWGTIDEVCGGTITAGSIGIWNLSSDKYAAPGKVGVISGGSISGTTAAIRLTDYDNTPDGGNKPSTTCKASASITGGTITGALDVRENTKLTISGGTFDRPIDSKYCASGFVPKANSDGTYGVTRPSSGSSSSSSYDPTYSVSTPSKTEHGTVTVSPKSASKGDTVTVTVKPDSGYVLETLTVTDKNGNELTLKDKGNGKYTFTMPAGKVEVKATFMEDNSMLNFFYDVPNNAYFYEAVKWAVENGITTGVGNDLFAPEQPCTRAQIVTFLWRAAGSPEPKGAASGMSDVVSGSYYEKAVAWAIENGITTGTTTTMFSPNVTCTRAQAVTFLARALKAKAASAAEFSDVPTGSYFADAVAWAAANGVTEGIGGGLFGSDNDCTRGQIVTFLYRAYNK